MDDNNNIKSNHHSDEDATEEDVENGILDEEPWEFEMEIDVNETETGAKENIAEYMARADQNNSDKIEHTNTSAKKVNVITSDNNTNLSDKPSLFEVFGMDMSEDNMADDDLGEHEHEYETFFSRTKRNSIVSYDKRSESGTATNDKLPNNNLRLQVILRKDFLYLDNDSDDISISSSDYKRFMSNKGAISDTVTKLSKIDAKHAVGALTSLVVDTVDSCSVSEPSTIEPIINKELTDNSDSSTPCEQKMPLLDKIKENLSGSETDDGCDLHVASCVDTNTATVADGKNEENLEADKQGQSLISNTNVEENASLKTVDLVIRTRRQTRQSWKIENSTSQTNANTLKKTKKVENSTSQTSARTLIKQKKISKKSPSKSKKALLTSPSKPKKSSVTSVASLKEAESTPKSSADSTASPSKPKKPSKNTQKRLQLLSKPKKPSIVTQRRLKLTAKKNKTASITVAKKPIKGKGKKGLVKGNAKKKPPAPKK